MQQTWETSQRSWGENSWGRVKGKRKVTVGWGYTLRDCWAAKEA